MVKAQYDLLYKEVVRTNENGVMGLEEFFDAIESMEQKLIEGPDRYVNLSELLSIIEDCLKS